MMPHNVATRWNSTFDMLNFAIEYRPVIEAVTSERKMDLRKYELSDGEWSSAKELGDILKVSFCNRASTKKLSSAPLGLSQNESL